MKEKMIGIIGGTGIEDTITESLSDIVTVEVETPFGKPSSVILTGTLGNNRLAVINRHGPGHRLSPSEVPFAANIFALKKLGAHAVISTGAVGSLQENIKPGDVVLVDQFIDKTHKRRNTFFENYAAVHCEFSHPTCPRLGEIIQQAAGKNSLGLHPGGTYVCMEGPQFSTLAESLMHRSWGADLIGMTALPEAKLAREAQMCYALIAMASDYDCWREHEACKDKQGLLEEIISNLNSATDNCLKLLNAVLKSEADITSNDCPCRKALELAVWTKPEALDKTRRKELAVLFE